MSTLQHSTGPVRVRFAPSPTGYLHIGSLRVALFNWLFARHGKGSFLLRIEDTDTQRSKKEYVDAIFSSLQWVDLLPDEPFILQSDRIQAHQEVIEQLLQSGKAYRCVCLPDEIKARQPDTQAAEEYLRYDGYCRDKRIGAESAKPYAVRFAVPRDITEVSFDDIIRGYVSFTIDQFDDFVIARSDGNPVYNFVVVVDDAFMEITHVIRGEDHISNTPKQILLYRACGYTIPQFAHLPLILGSSGQRLSKRDAATGIDEYRQLGYLPDALSNYLVRLGWAHGDQEVFTRDELIAYFSLEQVGKKSAIFDLKKLNWLNGLYMRARSDESLLSAIKELRALFEQELQPWHTTQVLCAIALYKERTSTLLELADEIKMVHDGSTPYDAQALKNLITDKTIATIQLLREQFDSLGAWDKDILRDAIEQLQRTHNLNFAHIAQPIRAALTAKVSGPAAHELLWVVGKEESLARLHRFLLFIKQTL